MNEENPINKNPIPVNTSPIATPNPAQIQNPAPKIPDNTMQNVVQEFLPEKIKKDFVMQKNNSGQNLQDAIQSSISQTTTGDRAIPPYAKTESNFVQKAIRTYESDLADALANKQTSAASIAIAENKRREQQLRGAIPPQQASTAPEPAIPPRFVPPIPPKSAFPITQGAPLVPPATQTPVPRKPSAPLPQAVPAVSAPPVSKPPRNFHLKPIFLTIVSLAFIGGGIFMGYSIYEKSSYSKPVPTPATIVIQSLIPHDKQVSLTLNSHQGSQLITSMYAELNKHTLSAGKNLELILIEKKGETSRRVTASEFMGKLVTNTPDIVLRSLTDRWMFGTYTEETGRVTTYMALTTDFFQNTFAGMLIWEDSLPDDLALLLNYKDRARRDELNASSTTSSYFSITGTWSDKVIRNRDVREFKNRNGELLLLYSFINKQTIVISTTESSLIGLLDRIEKDTYVR